MTRTIIITDDDPISRDVAEPSFLHNPDLFGEVDFRSFNGNKAALTFVESNEINPSGIVADYNTNDGLSGVGLLKGVSGFRTAQNLPPIPMAVLTGAGDTVKLERGLKNTPRTTIFRREYFLGELELLAIWFHMQFYADTLEELQKNDLYDLKREDIIRALGEKIDQEGQIEGDFIFKIKIEEKLAELKDDVVNATREFSESLKNEILRRQQERQGNRGPEKE